MKAYHLRSTESEAMDTENEDYQFFESPDFQSTPEMDDNTPKSGASLASLTHHNTEPGDDLR